LQNAGHTTDLHRLVDGCSQLTTMLSHIAPGLVVLPPLLS
jgi:hypothetical protein